MNRKLVQIIVVVAIFLVSFSSLSIVYATNSPVFVTPVNLSNDKNKAGEPNIQNSGSNVYVAWSEGSHGIFFRSSPDGGVTWNPPLTKTALKLSVNGGVSEFPLMITNNGSYVYVAWAQTRISNGTLQVYFTASSNFGVTFTKAKVIDNMLNVSCMTPVIAASGKDVYVAFNGNGSSFVTASSNNGATWTKPVKYASGPEPQIAASGSSAYAIADTFERNATAIAITHNNGLSWSRRESGGGSEPWISAYGTNVIASWESKGNKSLINVITSTNSGKTFSKPTSISSTVTNSWSPMTGLYGNIEYVAWRSNPGGTSSQEYVAVSINAGKSWGAPIAIGVSGRDNEWPFTVEPSLNNVYVMWAENTSTKNTSADWQILVSYSSNNGSSWTIPPISLTSSPAAGSANESDIASGAISSSGPSAYAAWQNNATTSQIYFSHS